MDPAASPKAGETFINATTPTKTTAANQNNYCSKLAAVFSYAMYQHSDMQPLNVISSGCDTLYARKERTIDELAAENDALRKKADELKVTLI